MKYVYKVKSGVALSDTRGRCKVIDDSCMQEVVGELSGPISTRKCNVLDLLNNAAKKTNVNQGQAASLCKNISRRSIGRYMKAYDLCSQVVEETTDARFAAVHDIYNAIIFAVMNEAIAKQCKPQLIINYDATQFKVGYTSDKKVECVILESERYMRKKVRKLAGDKGITSYFIKWFAMINAFGNTSDPVFIVADKNMKEDIIYTYYS